MIFTLRSVRRGLYIFWIGFTSPLFTVATGMSPIVRKVDLYELCILRTLVPRCRKPYSSLVGPNMQTITSAMSPCPAAVEACIRLRAASDDGRSDDLCDPTSTIGTGEFCTMNESAAAV